MANRFAGLVAALLFAAAAFSQPLLSGASELRFRLDRLASSERVLMIGAHPDDELNGLLAHLATNLKMHTAYLSLTRGEGGQNLIGTERGAVLGVLREEESYAAGALEHAGRYFTSAVDFGYSKSAGEALRKWDRQKVLGEMVALIRRLRPQTIISVWSGTASDGHGQHQASGILAREAFAAAADSAQFPASGKAWRAERYLLAPRRAQGAQTIEIGVRDPVTGHSGAEIGGMSRSRHRSQGQGDTIERASEPEYIVGDTKGWALSPPGGMPADLAHPEAILPKLFALRSSRPASDTDEVIALAAGLWMDARVGKREFAEGEPWPVTFELIARSTVPVRSARVIAGGERFALPSLPLHQPARIDAKLAAPSTVRFEVDLGEGTIAVERPVVYRYADAEWGERTAPPTVLPPVTLRFAEDVLLFTDMKAKRVAVDLRSSRAGAEGTISIEAAAGWKVAPAAQSFRFDASGLTKQFHFEVTPPGEASRIVIRAVAQIGGKPVSVERTVLNYSHIPLRTVLTPATATVARAEVRVAVKRVVYVPGAGDLVPEALRRIGVDVQLIEPGRLASADLSGFDALVFGIRAFNVYPELAGAAERVRSFANSGGLVLVQYNTSGRGLELPIAPHRLKIGHGRVSVEEAPVSPLLPEHSLWTWPNQLSLADFEGWVQERGLYFAEEWDPGYAPLLSMADPGEPGLRGSVLYSAWGKGAFVYTGLSFFRQLPAGVPGAYRLFANILSAAKHAPER